MEAVASEPSALSVRCAWCGKTYEEHLDAREPGVVVPRVPCLLLKSGFRRWQITMGFAAFCGAIMIYRSVSRQTRNSLELSKINADMQIELARISKLQAPAIEHKPTNKQHEGM